jgi:hypothetical protein
MYAYAAGWVHVVPDRTAQTWAYRQTTQLLLLQSPFIYCCSSCFCCSCCCCAGPFVDQVRNLNGKGVKHAVTASSGAHVTLPEWYGSPGIGMIVPKTKVQGC